MFDFLKQLDQDVFLFINGIHNAYWDNFMWLVSSKFTWMLMYASILFILFRNFNIKISILIVIAIALLITYCDQICASILRPYFERLRPANLENPISELVHIVNGKRGGRYGFPSCHSSNSFGLAFFLIYFFKQRPITIFVILWAILVSYSRSYLGVHYPGDLLAGAVVGFTGGTIIYYLLRLLLKINFISTHLDYSRKYERHIEEPHYIKETHLFIFTGLLSIVAFLIYSFF